MAGEPPRDGLEEGVVRNRMQCRGKCNIFVHVYDAQTGPHERETDGGLAYTSVSKR